MRKVLIGALAVLLCVGTAQAAISLSVSTAPCPVAGMTRYIVTAATGTSEVVATVSDLTINGAVHQVWDNIALGGAPSPQIDSLLARPADWYDGDTCLLILDDTLGDNGAWTETNDLTMGGSGLTLFAGSFPPQTGMGTYGHTGATSEGLDPAQQASTVPIMQVVAPTGVTMDVTIGYGLPGGIGVEDVFVDFPIPEPATMSLLVLGGVAMIARKRRS